MWCDERQPMSATKIGDSVVFKVVQNQLGIPQAAARILQALGVRSHVFAGLLCPQTGGTDAGANTGPASVGVFLRLEELRPCFENEERQHLMEAEPRHKGGAKMFSCLWLLVQAEAPLPARGTPESDVEPTTLAALASQTMVNITNALVRYLGFVTSFQPA